MNDEILKALDPSSFHYGEESWGDFVRKDKTSLDSPVIHVSGSNGKSSVCAFLESIYLASGYKVGAYFDAHPFNPRESIRYCGEKIPEKDFERIYLGKKKLFAKFSLGWNEILTAIAFAYLQEKKPDFVILEAGIGGEFDTTNLSNLSTVLSIVTSSGLTHTDLLGTTTSEIALTDAGILKEGCPLLIGKLDENSESALRDYAKSMGSKFYIVDASHFERFDKGMYHFVYSPFGELAIPSRSSAFVKDACLALEATQILKGFFPLREDAISNGLQGFELSCRGEKNGIFVFDGASNPEAFQSFLPDLRYFTGVHHTHAFFASRLGSNIALMLPLLGNSVESIYLTSFDSPNVREHFDYSLYEEDYPFVDDPFGKAKEIHAQFSDDTILFIGDVEFAMLAKGSLNEEEQ